MRKINKQAGFTLIELIMVIVILGVLSAFALPRFADLGGNARTASINGLAASLRAAANIAHAQQLANGTSGATAVVLEGTTITMVDGYPTADDGGIGLAAQVLGGDYTGTGVTAIGAGVDIVYSITGTAGGACQVTYTSANAGAATPTIATVAVVAGC
jgi:MSHA pilin protein MshA